MMMSDHNSSDLAPQRQEIKEDRFVTTRDNNNDQAPNASFQEAEFINPFCTRVQEIGEPSSRNIDNTNMHSFQPQSHDYRWTRDHPLEQVHGNLTMPVQTRRHLATDPEMCMFALTVSIVEPKNIKEAMADSAWIEAMQDELHQQIAQPGMNLGQDKQMQMVKGIANPNANQNGNGNVVAARAEGNDNGNNKNQIRCYNYRGSDLLARNCTEEAWIRLQAEEFDFMAAAGDLDEIEEVNANFILMANLQQTSTLGTQIDNAPVYDSNGPAEVHEYDNFYNNEIFNMFTRDEHVEQSGRTVEQNPTTIEETHAYFESLYNNLAIEVEKVNTVNRKVKETNADLTIELAKYKNQE
ncbi:hypothetical protein Tco_1497438, partial [Tanacetum coccineum]